MNNHRMNREKLALHYLAALERGDMDALAAILKQAEQDPILSDMIVQMHLAQEAETGEMTVSLNGHYAAKKEKIMNPIITLAPQTTHRRPVYRYQGVMIVAAAVALSLIAVVGIFSARVSSGALATETPLSLDALQPITADNISQIQPIMTLGRGGLSNVVLSPDGKTLAFGGSVGIQLRRVDDLDAPPKQLVAGSQANPIYSVFYSPDGSMMGGIHSSSSSSMSSSSIWLWDAQTGEVLRQIDVPDIQLYGEVFFSPDMHKVAAYGCMSDPIPMSLCSSYAMRIWDVDTGAEIQTIIPDTKDYISDWVFSPDWSLLAYYGQDFTRIQDMNSGEGYVNRFFGLNGQPGGIAFSPDGTLFATAGFESSLKKATIRVWKVSDLLAAGLSATSDVKPILTINTGAGAGQGYQLQYSPDGTKIYSADHNGNLYLWDAMTGRYLVKFDTQTDPWYHAQFTPDGKSLMTTSNGGIVQFWDTETGKEQSRFIGYDPYFQNVLVNSDHSRVFAVGQGGPIRAWDLTTTPPLEAIIMTAETDINKGVVSEIAMSPDDSTLAYSFGSSSWQSLNQHTAIRLHNLETGQDTEAADFPALSTVGYDIPQVDFVDSQTLVVAGSFTNQLMRLLPDLGQSNTVNLQNGSEILHRAPSTSVVYTPDKRIAAVISCGVADTTCFDNEIRLFNPQNGRQIARLVEQDGANAFYGVRNPGAVAFSSDGHILAAASCVAFTVNNPNGGNCGEARISLWDLSDLDKPSSTAENPSQDLTAFVTLLQEKPFVRQIVFTAGENPLMLVGGGDIEAYDVNLTAKTAEKVFAINPEYYTMTLSADDTLLFTGGDGVVQIWGVAQ